MGQTLAQTRAAAQLLLDNPGTSSISLSEWVVLINQANADVYRDLCEQNPSYFEVVSRITVAANTVSFDISGASYLNAVPYKLVSLMRLEQDAAVSTTNMPVSLTPMPWMEYDQRLRAGGWGPGNGFNGRPQYFTMRGDRTVYLAPINGETTYLNVHYVPMLAALTTGSDSTEVLGGRADEFQDGVAVRAAWLANSKRNGTNPMVGLLWQEFVARMKRAAPSRQMSGPHRVKAQYWGP